MISSGYRRKALSLVEIMLTVFLVGLTLLPLLTEGRVIHRQAHFSENHAHARSRARALLDLACSIDFETLEWIHRSAGHALEEPVFIDLKKLFGPGSVDLLFEPALGTPARLTPVVELHRSKMTNLESSVDFRRLGRDLGTVNVRVRWEDAADAGKRRHDVKLFRQVRRGQQSMVEGVP